MPTNNASVAKFRAPSRPVHYSLAPKTIVKSIYLLSAKLFQCLSERPEFLLKTIAVWKVLLLFVVALSIADTANDTYAAGHTVKDLLNKNGQIVIDPGKIIINPVTCLPPFIKNNNNQCVCPVGKKKQGNTCVPFQVQIFCQAPFVPNNNGTQCVCPAGKQKIGNNCIQLPLPVLCQPPFVKNNNNQCVCPAGQQKVGNNCVLVPVQIQCNPPFVPNANYSQCVCPAGTQQFGNDCQLIPAAPQCKWPFVYSNARQSCVCADGYRLNNSGSKCLRQQAAPTLPKSTVRQIQLCLGRLGYDTGPADGAIGGRTRSAWSQFQRDENLRSRPNSLSDEVTQDRLFQACDKLDEAAAVPLPPPSFATDDNAPASDGSMLSIFTNFDPENGYPPLQCATSQIADLLKGLSGEGAEIGICGEVCQPIPLGMTAEQVEATAANINWCLNCTMIGDDQMLCSSDPKDGN